MLAYGAHSDAGKSLLNQPNITGDGTGYLLMVKKNFESYAQKLKDMAKVSDNNEQIKSSSLPTCLP